MDKIKGLDELPKIVQELKIENKKIVQCHGCFDMIHIGHIKHFSAAKKLGDVLIVTVTPDRYIEKGPGRPLFNEELRIQALAALVDIDYVALNNWPTAVETIKLLRPDIYVKGKEVLNNAKIDYLENEKPISNLKAEEEALKSVGGLLHLTDEISFSTSSMINETNILISKEASNYLSDIKKKFKSENILHEINSLNNLKILVLGDTIIDEYVECKHMEKANKEPYVSSKSLSFEEHAGGILAVANHVVGFSDNVDLLTLIGKNDMEFLIKKLNPKIKKQIIVDDKIEVIRKRRYIESYRMNKLFEVYNSDFIKIGEEIENKIIKFLENNIKNYDLILVSDYGHGFINQKILDYLVNSDAYLAVCCQLNSGNLGYNFITKYKRANFILLNDREIKLPFQVRGNDLKEPIKQLSQITEANKIIVTLGKSGSIYFNGREYFEAPAMTKNILDTMGSGDAVFSITALLTFRDTEENLIPFVGNCIGALAVNIIGNREPVNPIDLKKFINYILK